jgi:hypothetical protein
MEVVAKYFKWNMGILKTGILPEVDFYGKPWACEYRARLARERIPLFGPYKAVFGGWKGDLKARREGHACSASFQSREVCDSCRALQPFSSVVADPARRPFLYTDFSPTAEWRFTYGQGDMKIEFCFLYMRVKFNGLLKACAKTNW